MLSYIKPPLDLLAAGEAATTGQRETQTVYFKGLLEEFIASYKIKAAIRDARYNDISVIFTLALLEDGESDKLIALREDLEMRLASPVEIRTEANCADIAVMRYNRPIVPLRSVLESEEYRSAERHIPVAVGIDVMNNYFVLDLGSIDNLMITGTTGSGKSTFLNDILLSIVFSTDPQDLRLIFIDNKIVDLSPYHGLPHLMCPTITQREASFAVFEWAASEAAARRALLYNGGYKDLGEYNRHHKHKLCETVIVCDEFVEYLRYSNDKEEFSFRLDVLRNLTLYTKNTGIHLILTAQHVPKAYVTPLIKENINHRISFATPEKLYSRMSIGRDGAERLFGLGDMLYVNMSEDRFTRVQAAFCSFKDVDSVVDFVKTANRSMNIDRTAGYIVSPDFAQS